MNNPGTIKYIADAMLGRLATWLRILGYDVEYFSHLEDKELAERVATTGRILLTRDTLLIKRRKIRLRFLYIHSDHYFEQLQQVVQHFSLDCSSVFTRCLRCNEVLLPVAKDRIRNRVPVYVFKTQDNYTRCPVCDRIYWPATHRKTVIRQLENILNKQSGGGNVGC